MKIAILADPLDNQSAGVHTYTRELIQALVAYDQENEYLIIREKKDPKLSLEQIAIPNIRLPIGFASLRLFFIIPFILRFKKVDAVLETAHFGPFNLPKRIKRITMIHDLTPLLFPEYHRYHSQLLQRIFLKKILRKADLILSNSQNTTKDIARVFPFAKSKTKTILLGRDLEFKPILSRNYLNAKELLVPYFLFAGTIEPRKNLEILLAAYHSFRKETDEKILLLITGGGGWKTENFFIQLEKHPFREDIVLTGFVKKEELIELYSNALALIYPSLYEGFGFPIVEALACGTKVICSNNSSLPEVGGSVCLYFDPKKEKELLIHLKTIFEQSQNGVVQKEELIRQAEQFSWEKYANEFNKALVLLSNL